MITFDKIPQSLRYPGVYIEVDGNRAGLGGDMPAVLLVGTKRESGSAPEGEVTPIHSVADAQTKAGAGSMLAQMAAAYRNTDPVFDIYMLPLRMYVESTGARGSISVYGSPTKDGVLTLYIGGRRVQVALRRGMDEAEAARAIGYAVANDGPDMLVMAAVSDLPQTVDLIAKDAGPQGNDIDIRVNALGEDDVTGLLLTIAPMAGGSGGPIALDNLPRMLGQRWFKYVALGLTDPATMAAFHAESQARYQPPVQAGFRVFSAYRGGDAAAVLFGSRKNYEHICCLALGINPTPPWQAAAALAAAAAPRLQSNPVISLEGTPLPGVLATSYFDWQRANSLLFNGMSILEAGPDGACYIKRLITLYRQRSDGSADDAWLDINTPEVMERIRYEQRMGAIKRFRGTVAAKTDEGYRPGLPITTEAGVRAFLISLYRNTLMAEYGWVQDPDSYKRTLIVEQDPLNPSRFNFHDQPIINSPFYIIAGRSAFVKLAQNDAAPSAPAQAPILP